MAEAEGEVVWFASALLPDLRASTSREVLETGWRMGGAERVAAVEDQLTVL